MCRWRRHQPATAKRGEEHQRQPRNRPWLLAPATRPPPPAPAVTSCSRSGGGQLPLPSRRFAAHGATEAASVAAAVLQRLQSREHHSTWHPPVSKRCWSPQGRGSQFEQKTTRWWYWWCIWHWWRTVRVCSLQAHLRVVETASAASQGERLGLCEVCACFSAWKNQLRASIPSSFGSTCHPLARTCVATLLDRCLAVHPRTRVSSPIAVAF